MFSWGRRRGAPKIASAPANFAITACDFKMVPAATSRWLHKARDDDGNPIWPDNPDEVPAWRLEREAWAASVGVSMPGYRTRREWDQALDIAAINASPGGPPVVEVRTELEATDVVAKKFLSYMRQENLTGVHPAQRITEIYHEFCNETGRAPGKVDHVKAALSFLRGVKKEVEDRKRDGERKRTVVWIIESEPVDIEEVDTAPAMEMPRMRMAA